MHEKRSLRRNHRVRIQVGHICVCSTAVWPNDNNNNNFKINFSLIEIAGDFVSRFDEKVCSLHCAVFRVTMCFVNDSCAKCGL